MESKYQMAFNSKESSQVIGDKIQSSNSDNICKREGNFQAVVASLFSASSGHIQGTSAKIPNPNMGANSASMNPITLNSFPDPGLSVGRDFSLMGISSPVLKDPEMLKSVRANKDGLNLLALPLLSSHNSSISGSWTTGDFPTLQQGSRLSQHQSRVCGRKRQQGGWDAMQGSQNSLLNAEKQELYTFNWMHKRPRLDTGQDAVVNQHSKENQKQLKLLQLVPELQGIDLKKQTEQQMKDYFQQLALQQVHHMQPFNHNVCSRRLMQYMYHLQHRPPENDIAYWRKFVAEYYAPTAKKRWCLSLCDSVSLNDISIFRQATEVTWKCELCSTKCGRGFEAKFEALPRLKKVQFESGVINELLFLELPHESRLHSGLMILEYERAVHKTVFDQLHVVREGKLRIVFTLDLKMLSWEFCSRDHEELLPRSLITLQVNEFIHAAQEYQETISGNESAKIPSQVLEEKHNMLLSAGCKLQRNLDLKFIGELGFSKRYLRCLQIADFFSSMKDLMIFSLENKAGPIESLKNYTQKMTATKFQRDEFEEKVRLEVSQGMAINKTKLLSLYNPLIGNENAKLKHERPWSFDRLRKGSINTSS